MEKNSAVPVSCISFRGIVAMATLGGHFQSLGDALSGGRSDNSWKTYFHRTANLLEKYQRDLQTETEIPLTEQEILLFIQISHSLMTLPTQGGPVAGMRITPETARAIMALGTVFEEERFHLPWNGRGIAEAIKAMGTLGERAPETGSGRHLISYDEFAKGLAKIGMAFAKAQVEMTQELRRK